MNEFRILNLYSGIGGNRQLWNYPNLRITAVEYNKNIASIYKDLYPDDNVIVGDAIKYLLENYKDFDFIWASPPCPSHSRMNYNMNKHKIPQYIDMSLYQIIIFLKYYYKGIYCVENVKSYYPPLIKPQELGRHYYWANFSLPVIKNKRESSFIMNGRIKDKEKKRNVDLSKYKGIDKKKILNNCVEGEYSKLILDFILFKHQKKVSEF